VIGDFMGLNDLITSLKNIGTAFKDEALSKKITLMSANAEIYDIVGEKEIYNLIKRRCVENYNNITDPKIKKDVETVITTYLSDNIRQSP
jgi:hypothetical protein